MYVFNKQHCNWVNSVYQWYYSEYIVNRYLLAGNIKFVKTLKAYKDVSSFVETWVPKILGVDQFKNDAARYYAILIAEIRIFQSMQFNYEWSENNFICYLHLEIDK